MPFDKIHESEEFRIITGYSRYYISNFGRIYDQIKKRYKNLQTSKNNTIVVKLYNDQNVYKAEIVKKLVLAAFSNDSKEYFYKCIDGNENNLHIGNLKYERNGYTHILNLVGKRYDRLTVIERVNNNNKMIQWKCICDCGQYCITTTKKLNSGNKKSCGCLYKDTRVITGIGKKSIRWLGYEEMSGKFLNIIKNGARNRNLEFLITPEYLWNLYIKQNKKCSLSGLPIYFNSNNLKLQTASLDRIDNNKGYIEGNVQWLNRDVNWMKGKFDQKYFTDICKSITINLNNE